MPDERISVVICAYTEARWDQTCAAVASLRPQTLPCLEVILVVDYNPVLFDRLTAALPDVTVVQNDAAKGLSGARNTGVARARGEIIAFLDDDAVAHGDWLKWLHDAYADSAVIGVGGLTLPDWQESPPEWFPAEFYWVIGCNYRGMPDAGQPVRNLLGGNMSFRREAFAAVDGFRAGIGRTAGKRPLGCEETEFCIRLSRNLPGSVLVIEERAVISHYIPVKRGRFDYFVSRCFAEGISKAQVTAEVGQNDGLSAERDYVSRALPRGIAGGLIALARGDLAGPLRASAIVVGFLVTAAGYATGCASALGSTSHKTKKLAA
jgi:glucosyl-dolichyl phosphate glucuronosyltransferase